MSLLFPGRNLVLIGMMGTGKTAVGRILAEHLGRDFFDTDDIVAREAGRPIGEIFAVEGERGFREREAFAVREVATQRGRVVAVGGGAVLDPANVTHLRGTGDLVLLDAPPQELAARLGGGRAEDRPLLGEVADADDLTRRLADLRERRRDAYDAAADHVVATAGRDPAEVAADVLDWARTRPGLLDREEKARAEEPVRPGAAEPAEERPGPAEPADQRPGPAEPAEERPGPAEPGRIPVPVPGAAYDVVVGAGVLDGLAAHVPWPQRAARAALVSCPPVAGRYGERVAAALAGAGLEVHDVDVPDGEQAKTLATLEAVCRRFASAPLNRDDVVVALGGGVVGDLAGFAAAVYNRGVAVVQVPTSLLAQVDAAVGGKTGVNLPEGKNLVGAFHQPIAVVADVSTLATLPERELRAGLAEVVKYGFIDDPAILEVLEADPEAVVSGDAGVLAELVRRSVAVKARVVAADERESGQRALLNYGHTVGHAIETLTGYGRYRHGEAVALGMVFAARLGELVGVSAPGVAERTVGVLRRLGLPTGGVALDPEEVWRVLARDKKARGGVRFVLCPAPGQAVVVDVPERAAVDEALRSLA